MDWANESYVRIYSRDTTTWKLLGWEGQCVLMHVLRRMDLSGVLDLADLEPWEAVVIHCGAPEPAARAGMDACLRRGVLVHNGACLIAPNYRAAQETSKSDRQRQRECRARRRSIALTGEPENDGGVTERDISNTGRDEGSRSVNNGHGSSQRVTPSGALQSDASPAAVDDDPIDSTRPAWVRVWGIYERVTGNIQGSYASFEPALRTIAKVCDDRAHRSGKSRDEVVERCVRSWLADPWVVEHRPPISHLAKNPAKYLDVAQPTGGQPSPNPIHREIAPLRKVSQS